MTTHNKEVNYKGNNKTRRESKKTLEQLNFR
jgi:hypothetical protein